MRRRWGADRARRLSRRLQQLEAMASLDDLRFMPFDSHDRPDGVVEISVDDDLSLFVREVDQQEDGQMYVMLMISALGGRSIVVA